ncbi:hypothetical protein [Hymenobacter sp. YC55]|uniref:hypothetical protein n=1 Tax=Hymenobacter sp. YC55 TaxID=3034019 RepID=UPI0023F934C8|nr:hypothetical protein [Hymenobacter sp. YC55]MDF7811685.1 hypothetical protein [Hymenobacter sp. YC55]
MKRLLITSYPWQIKMVLIIYTVCFLVGTSTHAAGLLRKGFLAFPVPLLVGLYWDALTLIDPVTAALLWWRPKVGLWLAVGVMASDISINTYVYLSGYFGSPVPNMVPLSLFDQALFGLFVFVTAPLVYQHVRRL